MESDSVRIALIEASLNASSRARREAAALLLDALRSETGLSLPDDFVVRLQGEVPDTVVAEVRNLIAELGLAKDDGKPRRN